MISASRLAGSIVVAALVGGGLVAVAVSSGRVGSPTLRVVTSAGTGRVIEVHGLPASASGRLARHPPTMAEWQAALALYVDDSTAGAALRPAVLAHYDVVDGRIRLSPRFPLTPGVAYRTRIEPAALARLTGIADTSPWAALEERFTLPATTLARTTHVLGVHPSHGSVPANLLRWYIELSAPMEPGTALEHVKLIDAAGREVAGAFLTVAEELWSSDRRRLTLLFDPGRVKRGIRTNLESGAPLIEGRRYRLVVDAEWRDGRGAALASGYEHPFEVGPADRTSPQPAQWRVQAPAAGTHDPLHVDLAEPLDHGLLSRMLSVVDSAGHAVAGRGEPGEGDATWRFVPDAPWSRGTLHLRASALLEDLAGNNVARVFDADARAGMPSAPVTTRPFTVR